MDKLITVFSNFFIALVLTSFSFSASANRPAMEERSTDVVQQKAQEEEQTQDNQTTPKIIQQPEQTTGDVLVLPPQEIHAGETINIKKIDTPRRGVSMNAVRRQLGEPVATTPSVGQPPISSWTYKDRIVYFEYNHVIHVVAR